MVQHVLFIVFQLPLFQRTGNLLVNPFLPCIIRKCMRVCVCVVCLCVYAHVVCVCIVNLWEAVCACMFVAINIDIKVFFS